MQRYEQMEERMEIVLSARQIMALAVLIVGVAMVMFVVGFSMGKRSERRRVVLGTPQAAADLLTRLDEMEKESREFVAKKALTQIRKREIPVEELNAPEAAPETPETASGKTATPAPRAQGARAKAQGTIALNKARPMAPAAVGKPAVGKPAVGKTAVTGKPTAGKPVAAGKTTATAGRTLSGSFGPAPRRPDAAPARQADGRRAAAQN
jgi:hypothetical protein